eukprot:231679_1
MDDNKVIVGTSTLLTQLMKQSTFNDPHSTLWKETINAFKIVIEKKISNQICLNVHDSLNRKCWPIIDAVRYGEIMKLSKAAACDMLTFATRDGVYPFLVSYQLTIFALFERWSSIMWLIDCMPDSIGFGAVGIVIENISEICMKNDDVSELIKLMFLTQFMFDTELKCYSLSIAALMIFAADIISDYLQQSDVSQISVDLHDRANSWNVSFDINKMAKILKNWQLNVSSQGMIIFQSNVEILMGKMKISGKYEVVTVNEEYFVIAKIFMKYKLYDHAIYWLTRVSVSSGTLYVIVMSLRYLSKLCEYKRLYGISFRSLKVAKKYCCVHDVIVLPSFCDFEYPKAKKRIRKKLKRMVCCYKYCVRQKLDYKVKSCTGCMSAMYCSKQCQKRDWVHLHRNVCNGSWREKYKRFKSLTTYLNSV